MCYFLNTSPFYESDNRLMTEALFYGESPSPTGTARPLSTIPSYWPMLPDTYMCTHTGTLHR